MQNTLKDIFAPIFEAMLKGEMNAHSRHENNASCLKDILNRRNGYLEKTLNTSSGSIKIKVPRDRDSLFEPKLIAKRSKDISGIEDKVIAMYARGMSQRDISNIIEDIYGFVIVRDNPAEHPWITAKELIDIKSDTKK